MSTSSRPANRLGEETSPYLLQHAFNPVDWYPWGPEALERARREDRPILLSVGYSACHWCHVMERESFENDAIANLMNSLFVNIKVDREERPDLDRIYQLAHQLLTRRPGGWPLTAFLTPIDHAPLFVGTYFPAEPHHGLPGFGDLLQQVAQHYTNNRSQMGDHAKAIRQALQQTEPGHQHTTEPADTITLETAARQLEDEFDAVHGGFGKAPKFPHPTHLSLLLRLAWSQTSMQGSAYQMTIKTLGEMASGGLWDHVTGGFYRYAVDDQWRIPHFEKMLYD
ncbi:MAG TPA: thioredoxin domain-containing protein, partial [Gammaproteobacteria bacterium]|nr:thioredoxin domain-containing protein [Gammaproteobacteria bacterium]